MIIIRRSAQTVTATAAVCIAFAPSLAGAASVDQAWRARVSARLLSLYDAARRGQDPSATSAAPKSPAAAPSPSAPRMDAAGRVQVDVHYDCGASAPSAALTSAGLLVNASVAVPPLCVVEGWIAPDALSQLAGIAGVTSVRVPSYALPRRPIRPPPAPADHTAPRAAPPASPRTKAAPQAATGGAIDANGVSIMRTDQFLAQTGTSGVGVTVGVQSAGVSSLSVIQQRGELPSVRVLTPGGQASSAAADEGTMLLEEIHAVAPGASLAYCGPQTFIEYTACLGQLIATGATILTDDVIFPGEDIMAADSASVGAVEQILARNPAVTLFTSAGNYNGSYWEGMYEPVSLASQGLSALTCPAGNGTQTDAYVAEFNGNPSQQLTVTQGGPIPLVFAWADPADHNVSNFDLYWIKNDDSAQTGCFSTAGITGNLIAPTAMLEAGTYTLYVATTDPSLTGKFLKLWIGGDGLTTITDPTPGSIVSAQSFAPGVITVGAVDGADGIGDRIEDYSSRGPITLALPAMTQAQAPLLAAPDGIHVDASGTLVRFLFADGNFYGTSASAPNAAAVAALLRAAFPSLTAAQLLTALQTGAVPLGTTVPDDAFGFGRVDALGALGTLASPTITPLPDPALENGLSSAAYPLEVSGTGNLHFTVTSSDPRLIPAAIVAAGSPGITIAPATCGTDVTSCTLMVTSAPGYGGTVALTVSAVDGANRSAAAMMNITISGPPLPPVSSLPPSSDSTGGAGDSAGGGGGGGAFGWIAIATLALLAGRRAVPRRTPARGNNREARHGLAGPLC